jgi:hypothetical protein
MLALHEDPWRHSHISPHKSGNKFKDVYYDGHTSPAIERYRHLSLVSRQVFVEVVGSGLFHQVARFDFTSLQLMENYLERINPFHMQHCVRSIAVTVRFPGLTLPRRFFKLLQAMEGLRAMSITVQLSKVDIEVLLETIKADKGWEVMKGRLETLSWNWSHWMGFVDPGNAKNMEFEKEMRKMLVGRKWSGPY